MRVLMVLAIPALVRLFVAARFPDEMREALDEAENDRDANRALILALAGFSFTAVAALAVLDIAAQRRFEVPTLLLLGSFLGYLWALNIQGYKALRWHDGAASALADTSTLAMILALCALVATTGFSAMMKALAYTLAAVVWGTDFFLRVGFEWKYLTSLRQARSQRGKEGSS
jgi:hypothetical protein